MTDSDPLLGPIRLCRRCDEWWPDDDEFFYTAPAGSHPTRLCRACLSELAAEFEKKRPARSRAGWRLRRNSAA